MVKSNRHRSVPDRQDWSRSAWHQLFGPDQVVDDPLPQQLEAVARLRERVQHALDRSRTILTDNSSTKRLAELIPRSVADLPESSSAMRVVLMGRTMAGKSTLLAALTGGSDDRIGVGAQRTSRDVF